MKKYFLVTFLAFGYLPISLLAFDIERSDFKAPGDDEMSSKLFLNLGGKRIMLPSHLDYNEIVMNGERTIAAINFHGLSNYNGVDLVVTADKNRILIIPDVWSILKNDLFEQKIIASQEFDHTYLRALKIEGSEIFFELAATSSKEALESKVEFSIFCEISDNGLALKIKK